MTIDDELTGTWGLASLRRETPAGEAIPDRPRNGLLTFSPGRRVMLMLTWADRRRPAGEVPTPAERAALHESLIAFAGTYSIEGDRLVFHIEMSWNEAWTGHDHPRNFSMDGDRLTLRTDPRPSAFDGRESVYIQVWEKLPA
jgi:hypothetical protein